MSGIDAKAACLPARLLIRTESLSHMDRLHRLSYPRPPDISPQLSFGHVREHLRARHRLRQHIETVKKRGTKGKLRKWHDRQTRNRMSYVCMSGGKGRCGSTPTIFKYRGHLCGSKKQGRAWFRFYSTRKQTGG